MKKKLPPKPRNPFIQHLVMRKSSVHGKTKKAIRQQEKIQLKKDYLDKVA